MLLQNWNLEVGINKKLEEIMDFYQDVRARIAQREFCPVRIEKPKRVRKESTEESKQQSRIRSKAYYDRKKLSEDFKSSQKEKNKRKYEARKADPEKWKIYLEQCRLSKLRRKSLQTTKELICLQSE